MLWLTYDDNELTSQHSDGRPTNLDNHRREEVGRGRSCYQGTTVEAQRDAGAKSHGVGTYHSAKYAHALKIALVCARLGYWRGMSLDQS